MISDIIITVSGKEHSGKTSAIAVIEKLLRDNGVNVTVAQLDKQLPEKQENFEGSLERIKNTSILITETIINK